MILKVDDLKKMLGITTATEGDNSQINALLPIVQDLVFDYLNNLFLNSEVYSSSSAISFAAPVSGVNSKITGAGETFITEGFFKDADFVVAGSLTNDGIYRINALSETEITLDGDTILKTEAVGETVLVQRMDVPDPIKLLMAKMVGQDLKKSMSATAEKESEKVGDYSVKYSTSSGKLAGYSEDIERILRVYRKPKYVKAL